MTTAYDVPAAKLIEKAAADLQSRMQPIPEWTKFVKTGSHVERPPSQENWFFLRTASVLRRIYTDGPVGVERLRTVYGGRKSRGTRVSHFRKSGGKAIRYALQQLESLEFVKKSKKGREISPKGRKYLDNMAFEVKKQVV